MIQFFESSNSCHIVLKPPLEKSDSITLESLLNKEYASWHVEFGRIYSVDAVIVNILYKEVFTNSKKITITTHKNKLKTYLYRLGFEVSFDSLVKKDIVDVDSIEVILIGGSADSSPKIIEIVKNTSLNNLSLILVQHVEPNAKAIFDEILQKYTSYKVGYAKDNERIKKGHIYIAPSNKHLKVLDGCFLLDDGDKYNFSKPSVSVSYESFSNYYKEKLLVIQECGYASDGVDRLELLKYNDSKLIIQDIKECEAQPMVSNALKVNVHNYVLNEEEIINYINLLDKNITLSTCIEYLLEMIFKKYDYDFRLYHRDMVSRRLKVFMIKHEIKNIKDTVAIILFNKSAFKAFFLDVSINVTELFRKPKSFKQMTEFLNKNYKNTHSIKIWSAGCSSGKEPYSMAILLDKLNLLEKSIIYATDFNSVVLQEAENAIYSNESYLTAKKNFSEIFFESSLDDYLLKNNNFITIDEKIKEKVLFFQHNLVLDSSFNEFDIIICKNVIIYFNYKLQQKVFKLFYDSLKFGGYLVLGESEQIHSLFIDKFEKCSEDCKIFKKVA